MDRGLREVGIYTSVQNSSNRFGTETGFVLSCSTGLTPYLIVLGELYVLVIVHVHGAVRRAVNDVGSGLSIDQKPMVVTHIILEEDALSLLVVARYQAVDGTKAFGGKFGDSSFDHCE